LSELVADYDFELPTELIASRPLPERDASRMLVLHRDTGEIEHRMFRDFPSYLQPGDLTVLNDSRVIKARLFSEDEKIELLLLEPRVGHTWVCLGKPGRKLRVDSAFAIAGTNAIVREVLEDGSRLIAFDAAPDLERYGAMPIPPYFKRDADEQDNVRYQTVFADEPGSVAAPTAGLHFTPEILSRVPHTSLTLHVGIGTFQPVKTDHVAEHVMHSERYTISPGAASAINQAKRIIAIGTTSARVLESQPAGPIEPHSGSTKIFIHPPYSFKHVGALLTNFHLPKSTLLMLVSAMVGREKMLSVYRDAIAQRYRFFSYGDCMLIL